MQTGVCKNGRLCSYGLAFSIPSGTTITMRTTSGIVRHPGSLCALVGAGKKADIGRIPEMYQKV